MKSSKKKDKDSVSSENEDQKILEEFADLLLEEASRSPIQGEDPFETYTNRVRSHIYSEPSQFRERFAKGFHLLVEQLSSEKFDAK